MQFGFLNSEMIKSEIYFNRSTRDRQVLVVDGYEFYLKRKNKTTISWNCSKYQSHKCRAVAITEQDRLVETRQQHNHDIFLRKPESRRRKSKKSKPKPKPPKLKVTSVTSIKTEYEPMEVSQKYLYLIFFINFMFFTT